MKYTNIKKLLIKFMGGGLINFPTRFLRWIKIDGDAEGDDSGGGGGDGEDASEEAFLFQVLTIINGSEGFYFDENTTQGYVFPISDWDDSFAEGSTLLGNKETADYVISGYNADDDITYYMFVTADELNTLEELYYPYKNYYNDWKKNQFAFPIEVGTHISFNNNTPYIDFLISNESFHKPGCLFDNHEFAGCILFGIENNYDKLGPEFQNAHFEVVEPKFSVRPGSEGEYDGFVYMNHKYIQSNYTEERQNAIYNLFESFYQRAYLASSTQYYDIYIVQLNIQIGSNTNTGIYTPYVVRKQG